MVCTPSEHMSVTLFPKEGLPLQGHIILFQPLPWEESSGCGAGRQVNTLPEQESKESAGVLRNFTDVIWLSLFLIQKLVEFQPVNLTAKVNCHVRGSQV